MEPTMLRSEAIKLIRTGQPCVLEFVTLDQRRGTGGQARVLKNYKILYKDDDEALPGKTRQADAPRDPRHHLNKTFNMMNPASRTEHPVKVHYRLMTFINGKRIING